MLPATDLTALARLVRQLAPTQLVDLLPLMQVNIDARLRCSKLYRGYANLTTRTFREHHFIAYLVARQVNPEIPGLLLSKLGQVCLDPLVRCRFPLSLAAADALSAAVLTNQATLIETLLHTVPTGNLHAPRFLFKQLCYAMYYRHFAAARVLLHALSIESLPTSHRSQYDAFCRVLTVPNPSARWPAELFALDTEVFNPPSGVTGEPLAALEVTEIE
ncbi:hypothetical protein IWQ60_002088 [Tieghemiomyces parasiticus]|uniref:Uncharacterized protein n=1 Tax=Tieghemiomyces parasiticus TaxID=78921 RepID=A0A9W8DXR0_9FUNG|nr:hypothetical protein IWQ60_002088 [Tieghemiomyces parasiticus]